VGSYVQICTDWLQQNGEPSLTKEAFAARVGANAVSVAGFLLAGRWHSPTELAMHTGLPDTEVIRAILAITKHTPACLKLEVRSRTKGRLNIYMLHRVR
jgi:hypothetical protein